MFRPAVAADPATGVFTVVWEDFVGLTVNPVDIKARRFDASGTPLGSEFTVNTTTDGSQGQPEVAVGPNGEFVIVWAGDSENSPVDFLDVFAQAYDATGAPIGNEMIVNSTTAGQQRFPTVRFLPSPDAQGNPQVAVGWSDTVSDADDTPNETGQGYKCFTLADDPLPIFADGFESGDTSSWSSTTEN